MPYETDEILPTSHKSQTVHQGSAKFTLQRAALFIHTFDDSRTKKSTNFFDSMRD
jgi:hypothetical protein